MLFSSREQSCQADAQSIASWKARSGRKPFAFAPPLTAAGSPAGPATVSCVRIASSESSPSPPAYRRAASLSQRRSSLPRGDVGSSGDARMRPLMNRMRSMASLCCAAITIKINHHPRATTAGNRTANPQTRGYTPRRALWAQHSASCTTPACCMATSNCATSSSPYTKKAKSLNADSSISIERRSPAGYHQRIV